MQYWLAVVWTLSNSESLENFDVDFSPRPQLRDVCGSRQISVESLDHSAEKAKQIIGAGESYGTQNTQREEGRKAGASSGSKEFHAPGSVLRVGLLGER